MNNYFWDTHAHILNEYYDDVDEVIKDASTNNIKYVINSGVSHSVNQEVINTCQKYKNVYGTLGIHPEEILNYKESDLKYIEDNINNPKILAIGEIGLDYHYYKDQKEVQKKLFEKLLFIAEKHNFPVVIHSREATEDTINILKKFKVTGVIHSFSGSYETAMEYIKLGYVLGINGVVTFKNSKFKDDLKKIPVEKIILETDCPYLTPEPNRGKKNSPANVKFIAEFVANVYEIPVEKLAMITNETIYKIFDKKIKL